MTLRHFYNQFGAAFQLGKHPLNPAAMSSPSSVPCSGNQEEAILKSNFWKNKCRSVYHFLFMVHFPDDNNNSSKHLKLRSAWDVLSLISKATINARFETAAARCDYFLQAWEKTKRMTWCWSNVGFLKKTFLFNDDQRAEQFLSIWIK